MNWNDAIADIGPPLYRFFLSSCEPALADDLVQETLVRLLNKVRNGQFNPALGNLRMYAFGIAQFVSKVPIGGERGTFMVTDNQGYLWGENVRLGGVISGISSHRGAFVMSFYPSKGSKELGYAIGKKIELFLTDTLKVQIRNEEELVPGEGRVKVYGYYNPNYKMKTATSVLSFGEEKVEEIPKEFAE